MALLQSQQAALGIKEPSKEKIPASSQVFVLTNCTLPTAYPLFVASLPNSKVEAAVPTILKYFAGSLRKLLN